MDSIPVIDLRLLSQADLNSLALSSSSAAVIDPRRCDDIVIPKIDRSVFNESAGSRKQTYSRLRLARPKSDQPSASPSSGRRRGRPRSTGLLPATPAADAVVSGPAASSTAVPSPAPAPDEPGRKENEQIVHFLRQLFVKNGLSETLGPPDPPSNHSLKHDSVVAPDFYSKAIVSYTNSTSSTQNGTPDHQPKKRGRKRKPRPAEEAVVGVAGPPDRDDEVLNLNGVAVDLVEMGKKEDLFKEAFTQRTAGLVTEEDFLGFLNGLEGQWGSRRKRRKIVDAGGFGDGLPKGWKLLLGLKRKEGSVWLHCRRYISPTGKQFTSCKEVSSYLLSFIGSEEASKPIHVKQDESTQMSSQLASGCAAGLTHQTSTEMETPSGSADPPSKSVNSAKAQLLTLLECQKCNLKFPDKSSHVQHLLAYHHRSAKRCRLGKSISSGVIIKDGKFECQFCHKIFNERHRYNGHVGIHVRNYSESLQALPDENIDEKSTFSTEPSFLAGFPLASSEVKIGATDEKENSINDLYSSNPINEIIISAPESANDGEIVCNQTIPFPDTTLEPSSGKSHNSQSNNFDGINEFRNDTNGCNVTDIELFTCLDGESDSKSPAFKSIGEKSNNVPESCIESSSKSLDGNTGDNTDDNNGMDENLKIRIEKGGEMDDEADKPMDISEHEPTPGTSVGDSVDIQIDRCKISDENIQTLSETSVVTESYENSRYPDLVYNQKQDATGTAVEGSTSEAANEQAKNMANEKPTETRIGGYSSNACSKSCNASKKNDEILVCVNVEEKIGCYIRKDDDIENALKVNDAKLDTCSEVDCNLQYSATANTLETQSKICVDDGVIQNAVNEISSNMDLSTTNLGNNLNLSMDVGSPAMHVDETDTEKSFRIGVLMEEAENFHHEHKDPGCHINNLSGSWQNSTEDGLFANTGTSELEKSLCEQQFYVENGLVPLSVEPSYSIQVDTDNNLTSGLEKHEVAAIASFNSQEIGLGIQQRVSSRDTMVENLMHDEMDMARNRQEQGVQNFMLFPPSSDQTCIKTHMGDIFPCNVQESSMYQVQNSDNGFEGDIDCGFPGSNRDSIMNDARIMGADTMESIAVSTSSSWMQSPSFLSSASIISDQGAEGKDFYTNQKHNYLTGFEGVRLDGFEPSTSVMLNDEDPRLRPDEQINFSYNGELENVYAPPMQLGWEMSTSGMDTRHHQVTTVCTWCGAQFSQQGINLQTQPDSIGYICQSCKSKISGQLKF